MEDTVVSGSVAPEMVKVHLEVGLPAPVTAVSSWTEPPALTVAVAGVTVRLVTVAVVLPNATALENGDREYTVHTW
nr:MAG TPA: hypothetical protein [Caudoviricetes sp.]